MKIHSYRSSNVNPYQKQMDASKQMKVEVQKDRVEISKQAKQLQQTSGFDLQRQEKVQEIKKEIESGTYKIAPDLIAKSMIQFYKKKNEE
ncbi:flagellar biosynthesis anti-sigma factor FlgM [Aeribacillus sp. FSL K6-8210]|uniref:flagellar biosynthesis anti-sigma factor FlgM n=1 Tax=Aeribacillus sp. FSL K6-8210 TaxID=2954683 RepID=UPI0030CCC9C8